MIEEGRVLGRGAGSVVRLGTVDGVEVAVKRPTSEHAEEMVRRHAMIRHLHHESLVRVIDCGVDDLGPYVLLDHVDGPTLETVLHWVRRADELIPIPVAAAILARVARGLSALHDDPRGGWVHGDLSPSNILVGRDGRVCLGDFDTVVAAGTRSQSLGGKPRYVAPERCADGAPARPSDVFALGAVLFETVFGIPLSVSSVAEPHRVSERLLDAMDLRDDLPEDLLDLLFVTLAQDPLLRPPSETVARRLLPIAGDGTQIRRYVRSFDDDAAAASISPSAVASPPELAWHIKGAALAATVDYLVDRFGEQELGRVVERLSDATRAVLQRSVDPSAWYDGQIVVELTLTAEEVFRSPPMKLARAIGAWSADRALSPGGPYQTFRDKGLRRGVRAFMEVSEDIYGLYYDVGEWRVVAIDDHLAECEITARLPPVIEERIFAYLDRAMVLVGAVDHRITRQDGPDAIRLRVTWR